MRILNETGTKGFEVQDLKKQNISAIELNLLKESAGGYEALFNKRAIKYKDQGLKDKALNDDDYRELILGEYTFLKRPVYLFNGQSFIGNDKKTVERLKAELGV